MAHLRSVPDPVRAPAVSPRDDLLRREDRDRYGKQFDREAFDAGWAAARARGNSFGCEACNLPDRGATA